MRKYHHVGIPTAIPREGEEYLEQFKVYVLGYDTNPYDFVLIFVKSCSEIQHYADAVKTALNEDALLWLAYPKKSSKKYQSDISRDDGWQPVGDLGFEGVRQIAIDEDWSAVRFRDARFIKSMSRDKKRAMSKEGKEKVK
jgi:hypothetical protein